MSFLLDVHITNIWLCFPSTILFTIKRSLTKGGGPSGFTCLMNQLGNPSVSIDPIYKFKRTEIEKQIEVSFDNIIYQAKKNKITAKMYFKSLSKKKR